MNYLYKAVIEKVIELKILILITDQVLGQKESWGVLICQYQVKIRGL